MTLNFLPNGSTEDLGLNKTTVNSDVRFEILKISSLSFDYL